MSNVKIHNFSNKLSTTYPRFGDKLIIAGGKHVNTHTTRCTPGTDTKNTTGCVREGWTGRAERLKSGGQQERLGRKNAGHGIPGEEICKMEKLENAGKQFDSGTLTRYNASRDYIALYLAREQ